MDRVVVEHLGAGRAAADPLQPPAGAGVVAQRPHGRRPVDSGQPAGLQRARRIVGVVCAGHPQLDGLPAPAEARPLGAEAEMADTPLGMGDDLAAA